MNLQSEGIQTYLKEYQAYHDAKQRCTNPNHRRYKDWGGRGIEFKLPFFWEFLQYMQPCPVGYSLDRQDNNGHYELGNVRWSNRSTQQHNRRISKQNTTGISGVRRTNTKEGFQAHINKDGVFYQLYCGNDFLEACCARKSAEAHYKDI